MQSKNGDFSGLSSQCTLTTHKEKIVGIIFCIGMKHSAKIVKNFMILMLFVISCTVTARSAGATDFKELLEFQEKNIRLAIDCNLKGLMIACKALGSNKNTERHSELIKKYKDELRDSLVSNDPDGIRAWVNYGFIQSQLQEIIEKYGKSK
jgi:hypothetical protein